MPDTQSLSALLQKEHDTLLTFLALLQNEQAQLLSGEVQQLPELTNHKLTLAQQLEGMAKQRDAWFQSQQISTDRATLNRWFESAPEAIRTRWASLLAVAAHAAQLNHQNGVIIETSMQHNRQALQAMQDAAQITSTYGPGGNTEATSTVRSFGKA